jgi:hypothetical protein
VIQRCILHKRRNLQDYLPTDIATRIDAQLARAFNDQNAARGLKVAQGIAAQLEEHYPSAAGSLRGGLEDMFTVRRLGTSDLLARSLSCTNAVESMISVVQRLCGRVTNWKDPKMVRRWVGVGMLEAERSFRRIRGCKDMPALTAKTLGSRSAPRWPAARPRRPSTTPRPAVPSRDVSVTPTCAACGDPVPAGRARRWCSPACRQAGWRRRHKPQPPQPPIPARGSRRQHSVASTNGATVPLFR